MRARGFATSTYRYKGRVIAMLAALAALSGLPASAEGFPLGAGGPGQYVILGDSYASGEGVDPLLDGGYFDGTDDPAENMCHRSSLAYGPKVAALLESVSAISSGGWLMPACSGDETNNLLNRSGKDFSPSPLPQIQYLDPQTRYVTLTIGGNDVGFADIITACTELLEVPVLWLNSAAACEAKLGAAESMISDGTMRARLTQLYRTVLQRAPSARLVVTTYPRLFPANSSYTGLTMPPARKYCVTRSSLPRLGFRASTVNRFNAAETALNKLITESVNKARIEDGLSGRISLARLDIGDLAAHPFACGDEGAPTPHINGVRLAVEPVPPTRPVVATSSFHPNEQGHDAFTPYVVAKLSPAAKLGTAVTSGGQTISGRGPLRVRKGATGTSFTVQARNGTPDWTPLADPSAPATYTLGFERLPASGLNVTSVGPPTAQTITATFDAPQSGLYTFRAAVTDSTDTRVLRAIDVEVLDDMSITTSALAPGTQGEPYSAGLEVDASVGPLTWSASGLPAGLQIDPTSGTIGGTPTTEGTYTVNVTADDTTSTATKTFVLEVRAPNGRFYFPGDRNRTATLSGDGRWLAYVEMRQISGIQYFNLWLRNTVAGADPIRISVNADATVSGGVQPNDQVGISDNGRFVAFTSYQRLAPEDVNNADDVYRYDRDTGSLALVPGTTGRRAGPISNDGRYIVVLEPYSSEPLYGALWRVDMDGGPPALVDSSSLGTPADRTVSFLEGVDISDDGTKILFSSSATNLDPADGDTIADLYLKDLGSGAVSALTAGLADGSSRLRSYTGGTITDDGRLVAFAAAGVFDGGWRQMLVDRTTGEKLVVAVGANRIRVSADGSTVAYVTEQQVPGTSYQAARRGVVTTDPLALTGTVNLSLNADGTEPWVFGSTPTAAILGISDDGDAILFGSNYGYQAFPAGGGYYVDRAAAN